MEWLRKASAGDEMDDGGVGVIVEFSLRGSDELPDQPNGWKYNEGERGVGFPFGDEKARHDRNGNEPMADDDGPRREKPFIDVGRPSDVFFHDARVAEFQQGKTERAAEERGEESLEWGVRSKRGDL